MGKTGSSFETFLSTPNLSSKNWGARDLTFSLPCLKATISWVYVIYQRKFVFEYSGKCMIILQEVKPILLEPGRFKVPCSARNKNTFQMKFLKALNFRLCALLFVLINISFVTL